MVVLNKANTADVIRLTLLENKTITASIYRIIFTSRQTKQSVTVNNLSDTSSYPVRYQKFTINTSTLFLNLPEGFWDYKAYAVGTTTELLEEGAMKLIGAAFVYVEHTTAYEKYKAYNG